MCPSLFSSAQPRHAQFMRGTIELRSQFIFVRHHAANRA
jgi:hypothetical protein